MAEKWETRDLHDAHYHSSRDERHEVGNITKEKDKRSFLQRNPSFKIFLIDLILILLISGVLVPYLYKREGSSSLEGFDLELKAFYFDDQVMATLKVANDNENIETDTVVEALFHFEENVEQFNITDILPAGGEERILKSSLSHKGEEHILCTVTINGKNKTIKKKIR